jgi:hypothetical protein
MTFANKAIKYFLNLRRPSWLTNNIEVMNPYKVKNVQQVVRDFYHKYFNDNKQRLFIFGINPGRFGGGLTGITFTDPVVLRETCGIENDLGNQKELSSKFIYRMIENYGGVKKFYSNVFISALYPLALIKDGKNHNYYDTKELSLVLRKEIIKSIKEQIEFGARRDSIIILGKKNSDFFSELNKMNGFFDKIIVLEHPRYIMQYRLKKINYYISKYLDALTV